MGADTTTVHAVEVPGARLAVETAGAGSPILFLHGWTLDRRMWRPQRDALAAHHFLLVPDRRGWGGSTGTPDLATEVGDVIALLDHFSLPRATLVAASQAGRVALRCARAHPERLSGLVLVGSALDGMPEPPGDPGCVPLAEWSALVQAGRRDEFERRWLAHPFMALPPTATTVADAVREMVSQSPLRDLAGAAVPAAALDLVPELPHIAVRTLVINGRDETPHRRHIGALLAQRIPGARHLALPGAHLVNLTAAGAFNAALAEFAR